jgi:hypothetical protein
LGLFANIRLGRKGCSRINPIVYFAYLLVVKEKYFIKTFSSLMARPQHKLECLSQACLSPLSNFCGSMFVWLALEPTLGSGNDIDTKLQMLTNFARFKALIKKLTSQS